MRIRHTAPLRSSADAAWPVAASFRQIATAFAGTPPVASDRDHARFRATVQLGDTFEATGECWLSDLGCDHDARCAFVRVVAREHGGAGIASGVLEVQVQAIGDRAQLELIADLTVSGHRVTGEQLDVACGLAVAQAGARLAHTLDAGACVSTIGHSGGSEDMKLTNEFVIAASIDDVWPVLLDLPRVARCVPGAGVGPEPVDGAYQGEIKVKLGPILMHYSGTARIVATDESQHEATVSLEGRERRGSGTVTAVLTNRLLQEDGATRVIAETDVSLTGRAAQFGRGIVNDVAGGVLAEFAHEFENELRRAHESATSGAAGAGEPRSAAGVAGDRPTGGAEALDLGRVAGARVLLRPGLALTAIVAVVLAWYLGRRRSD
jgi:uncharacterized protein